MLLSISLILITILLFFSLKLKFHIFLVEYFRIFYHINFQKNIYFSQN